MHKFIEVILLLDIQWKLFHLNLFNSNFSFGNSIGSLIYVFSYFRSGLNIYLLMFYVVAFRLTQATYKFIAVFR